MNRDELVAVARRRRIRPESYSFDPDQPGEHYVLSVERGGWSVYFSQYGHAREVERFLTEDEACVRLLERLVADPSTKATRKRSPAPRSGAPAERVATWQLVAAVAVLVALAWGWAATHQDGGSPATPTPTPSPAVSGR